MKTVEVVVECDINYKREEELNKIGTVKYILPMISSYVIEIQENKISHLKNIEGINSITSNTIITAQMDETRYAINYKEATDNYKNTYTGKGITIAILDTGVDSVDDLCYEKNRIIAFKDFINNNKDPYDDNAHGTHVAGIAAGNGYCSNGKYKGIAPESNIVALKILDSKGKGNAADVLAGMQWIIDNKEKYNIRIANLSIGTIDAGSNDPLVKSVEYAWDNGIVMVIAAGNNGPDPSSITSPGISKKVITVGASDDSI